MAKKLASYRRHSSGQARVTINGNGFLLGPWDSPESKAEYTRIIAEYSVAGDCFGVKPKELTMSHVLLAYLEHAKRYYSKSTEYANLKLAVHPVRAIYATLPAEQFGAQQFKAVRQEWLKDRSRTRQYINK